MADEQELAVEDKGGSNKMMLIIIVAAVVLIGGGIGGWLLLSGDDAPAPVDPALTPSAAIESTVKASALYVGMPRPFVFNVADRHRDRLVQVKVQLLVRGSANDELAKKHIPLIEGALLRTFSAATVDELSTQKGKEAVRERALKGAREAMTSITGNPVIEQVLFTGFVMQ